MGYDVIIRGGIVVDGTGAEPTEADVGVTGDRIVALTPRGELDDDLVSADTRMIDAGGRIVTPGFLDIHTHLDAQLSWDPLATSSCWHGVTSVVMGNCGVTFAPCRREDRRFLAELMESVEDIPADSIMDGLSWRWETYGQYLADLDALPKGVNAGGMVGHSAVRYHAMGDAALDDGPATDDQLTAMVALVEEAMAAGALGFSSSRTLLHKGPDGRPIPGTFAGLEELGPLVDVLGRYGGGLFETAAMLGSQNQVDDDAARAEIDLLAELSRRSGRPVTFGLTHTLAAADMHRLVLDAVASANAAGARLLPQTTVRSVGVLFGLAHNTPWDKHPSWAALRDLPLADKVAAVRDPERRAVLIAEATAEAGFITADRLFPIASVPARYDIEPGDSLATEAGRRGVSAPEAFLQLADETDGHALLNWPFLNQSTTAVQELLIHPDVLLGLADAGAHVGQIMDASQPTWFLAHWVRDRGLWDLADGVAKLTSIPAELFGIVGRGVLAEGHFADINVIDLDGLGLPLPTFEHDFPGGAGRWVQGGTGYDLTMVNGRITVEHGEHTGALPGRTLRSTDLRLPSTHEKALP